MKNKNDTSTPLSQHTKKPMLNIIREKCLDCCVGQHSEVRLCECTSCPLWPYRMAENPFRKHKLTKAQKDAATKRITKTLNT